MKTYEVGYSTELTLMYKVRAKDEDEAAKIAYDRALRQANSIVERFRNADHGDFPNGATFVCEKGREAK